MKKNKNFKQNNAKFERRRQNGGEVVGGCCGGCCCSSPLPSCCPPPPPASVCTFSVSGICLIVPSPVFASCLSKPVDEFPLVEGCKGGVGRLNWLKIANTRFYK
uniref:Uncharacterized protein n=1 Tax=Meloidogyne hapla TaxID=6305 RepID=A0A1I8BKB2_MELHA